MLTYARVALEAPEDSVVTQTSKLLEVISPLLLFA